MLHRDNLHEYQKYSIEFIKKNPISAIFLDCGLGKTVITLTAIKDLILDSFEVKKVLVICPLRVATVWNDELHNWSHLEGLTISTAIGSQSERLEALKQKADIYIINRENVEWLVNKSGSKFDFDMLVIDELSSFKSYQAKRFKSLLKVRPEVTRIVGLTGTPCSLVILGLNLII